MQNDDNVTVPDSAIFKCREDGKVTDLGENIDIQCMIQPGQNEAEFVYPDGWGTEASKCRLPQRCKQPFEAPLQTGLSLVMQEEAYYEFGYAKYQ